MSLSTEVERGDDAPVDHDGGPPTDARHPTRLRERWARLRPPGDWWWHLDDWLGLAILVACCVFVFIQLEPALVLRDTTPNGGDLGAHVWWPAYLRDHLLPWRLAGWSPDFYAGFPAGQFYFPVPALAIVGLDLVIPYNIAFKLIVVLGPVLVPAGAYVFARGLRAPAPTPAAFAVAATSFLFFTGDPGVTTAASNIAFNQRIMGGTIASTLAGEFSFTIALAFALFFFGTLASALRTRRHLWLPATMLALCLMSHLVVGVFAGIGALAVWLFARPVKNLGRAAAIGGVGVLLSAVWVVPLLATLVYTTNMRYGTIGVDAPAGEGYTDYLFPAYFFEPDGWAPYRWGAYLLAGIAVISAAMWVRRSTFVVLVIAVLSGLMFRYWAEVPTHVWNLRLLSFWYLALHLLMAIGVAELIRGAGWLSARGWTWWTDRAHADEIVIDDPSEPTDGDHHARASLPPWGFPPTATPSPTPTPTTMAATPTTDPTPTPTTTLPTRPVRPTVGERGAALVAMLVLTAVLAVGALVGIDDSKGFLPFWARWNFTGYEQVDGVAAKQWPEYRALMDELRALPAGRSFWEGGPSLDKYGTPLALMLIPYWTDGRIASMEGVYFEASATTPYHFEAVASLVASGQNSNPVRGVPYRDQKSFDIGVRYLQALGVNYFLVHSAATKGLADADTRLTRVATTPDLDGAEPQGWSIYRVADAPLVQGLAYEPVVTEGVAADPEGWEQEIAVPWWWFPDQLDRPIVADGPASWRHADGAAALTTRRRATDPVDVEKVRVTDDSISFRVDRVGEPVLVKASYFPNWEVDGAQGPYRATPNFMVVVPTEKDVTLRYGTTSAEWLGRFLTVVGLAGLGALVWWGRRARRRATVEDSAPGDAPAPAGTMPTPPA